MARREVSSESRPPLGGWRDIAGVLLLVAAGLLALALFSYDWRDVGWLHAPPNRPPSNFVGLLGAWSVFALFLMLGAAAFAVPFVLFVVGVLLFFRREMYVRFRFLWMVAALFALAVLIEMQEGWWVEAGEKFNWPAPGGAPFRWLTHDILIPFLGPFGTLTIAAVVVGMAAVLVVGRRRLGQVAGFLLRLILEGWRQVVAHWARKREERRGVLETGGSNKPGPIRPHYSSAAVHSEGERLVESREKPSVDLSLVSDFSKSAADIEPAKDVRGGGEERTDAPADLSSEKKAETTTARSRRGESVSRPAPPPPVPPPGAAAYPNYQLPPVTLLSRPDADIPRAIESDQAVTSRVIVETLADFGIEVQVTNVERGPVVTCYELLPAPGVKVERIASLSNNLALSLKAKSVRVQAPIPGKGVVGVEVPNTTASVVRLRDILEGEAWKGHGYQLPLVLGKDVGGNDLIADLATMPHLLIAGTTGSGKTVCMNSILAGLLMSRTPSQLNLLLVDPKIVEFTAYNGLPHLVGLRKEAITDTKKVTGALRWAIAEMERRYKLFAKAGVRNIQSYNSRPRGRQGNLFGEEEPSASDAYLPYIVIVVDELADLMLTAAAEIEGYIMRLAQLSRATGIHMILATQRPSVNVITGVIKANIPARIAFQVAQKVDSRTILDAMGADKLLGRGDMLFLPPGSSKMIRAQGCFTTDEDIRVITDFIRAQCPPPMPPAESVRPRTAPSGPSPVSASAEPAEDATVESATGSSLSESAPAGFEEMLNGPGGGDDDEALVEQAIQIIRETRRASTSALQRRMKIGYTRAARIMDILEERKIVGPPRGAEAREILMDMDGERITNADESQEESG